MCYVVSTIRVTGIYYDKYIWWNEFTGKSEYLCHI